MAAGAGIPATHGELLRVTWRRRKGRDAPVGLETNGSLQLVTTIDRRPDALLATVTDDLAASETGIEFVYRSLERLRDRARAEDVMVIVDPVRSSRVMAPSDAGVPASGFPYGWKPYTSRSKTVPAM